MTVATWKTNIFGKADAQKVADEISSIGNEITPADVVSMARDPSTESHKCFEWDDTKAAEKYRLQQARIVMCNLVYTEREEQKQEPIRLFYSIDEGKQQSYQPTILILQDKDKHAQLMEKCMEELRRAKAKYHSLSELDWLWEKIS